MQWMGIFLLSIYSYFKAKIVYIHIHVCDFVINNVANSSAMMPNLCGVYGCGSVSSKTASVHPFSRVLTRDGKPSKSK